jgi:uncharacterized protein
MIETAMQQDTQPWYRQGWPWLLISLPASAVVGGILTLIIAVQSPNALVVDDYYKEGLAINQEKHRVTVAGDMQLTGLVRGGNGIVTLSLDARQPVTDATLILQIIHATRSELDRTLTMQRTTDGSYHAALEKLPAGNWYFILQNRDKTWEIRCRTHIDGSFQTRLSTDKD